MARDDWIYASYMAALPYIRGRRDVDVRRVDLAERLLDALGAPHAGLPIVLVAGSKGKGSTAAFLAGLLRAAGLSVGFFSSPHLLSFQERIRVNGRMIDAATFDRHAATVREALEGFDVRPERGEYIGPIALWAAVAMLAFRESGIDVAVVEAGRGARYDDTAALDARWAVITPVFEEHRKELGPTLADIVWHKVGAVGPAVTDVFVGRQRPDVMARIRAERIAGNAGSPEVRWHTFGRDFGVRAVTARRDGTEAHVFLGPRDWRTSLRMLGRYQADNFALALAAADAVLRALGRGPLADSAVHQAARTAVWPGRMQLLSHRPPILVDATIHRSALVPVWEWLELVRPRCVYAVLGLIEGKDEGLTFALAARVDALWITYPSNAHYARPDLGERFARPASYGAFGHARVVVEPDVRAAIANACATLPDDGALVLLGTISFVADVLRFFGARTGDLSDPRIADASSSGRSSLEAAREYGDDLIHGGREDGDEDDRGHHEVEIENLEAVDDHVS